jgi:hypothetical protein
VRINILIAAALSVATMESAHCESVQGAVVTRIEGQAELLIKKGDKAQPANTKAVQIDKQVFYAREAKKGDRPSNGDVIVAAKDSKVRLIFRNGDQVTVAPDSAYRFSWDAASDKNPVSELLYGDIRAVINPGGPRSGMQVNTRAAVMGVRGTDFFASSWSKSGGSKVVVLRGKIAMAARTPDLASSLDANNNQKLSLAKATEIAAGASGTIKPVPQAPPATKTVPNDDKATEQPTNSAGVQAAPEIEVQQATKQELVVIQQDSKVAVVPSANTEKDSAVGKELALLEQKALDSTLSELKDRDPELYKELSSGDTSKLDSDVIQSATVKKIFVAAPSDTGDVKKPTLKDLETGGDVYERYKWKER